MKKKKLGSQGLEVSVAGLGCMGMTSLADMDIYGKADEGEAIRTIHRALELGMDFLDTADLYGPLLNERLISKAISGRRDQYTIASKFGFEIDDQEKLTWRINGQAAYAQKAIDRSLRTLNTSHIDLYYLHRVDPETPIEETVGAMAEMVKAGKVRYIGLSEVSPETLRRAHAVHPITAVQSEYSLFERTPEENGLFETMAELGVGFVSYSPLGRGFLTGELKTPDDLHEGDFRKAIPRFQGENFYKNIELVKVMEQMAADKGITAPQLAIAWTIAKGTVPIPGTKRVSKLESNVAAAAVTVSPAELEKLESIVPLGSVKGDRYDAGMMAGVNL